MLNYQKTLISAKSGFELKDSVETTGYTFISIWQANGVLYGAKVNA